jgi:hypothetical protein
MRRFPKDQFTQNSGRDQPFAAYEQTSRRHAVSRTVRNSVVGAFSLLGAGIPAANSTGRRAYEAVSEDSNTWQVSTNGNRAPVPGPVSNCEGLPLFRYSSLASGWRRPPDAGLHARAEPGSLRHILRAVRIRADCEPAAPRLPYITPRESRRWTSEEAAPAAVAVPVPRRPAEAGEEAAGAARDRDWCVHNSESPSWASRPRTAP